MYNRLHVESVLIRKTIILWRLLSVLEAKGRKGTVSTFLALLRTSVARRHSRELSTDIYSQAIKRARE